MAKISILQGATSVTVNIFIADSSSTTGAGLTGLVFNTASLVCYYMRPKVAATSVTLATLAAVTSAYSSGGFKEIDATNAPGWYRFDIPDAAIANAERFCSFHFKGATNMAPLPLEVELTGWDNQNAVRGGMTALPNATAGANTGLPIVGTQVPNATAGASGGLLISGSNAGTTTLGAFTVTGATTLTGNVSMAAGLTITQSSANTAGLSITGNGSGSGVISTGGATGVALKLVGGGTSGDGLAITTTSGHGVNIAATGASKHGATITGGDSGTSDGLKLVAGTGGVDLRANQTGNLVGTVSTLTTYTGNTPQTGDAYAVVNDASFGNSKLVRSTTPANTLDVSATGEAGLDFNNIKDASAGHTLTNITVPTVTTTATATAIGVNGLDAAALATDAVTEIVAAVFARAFSAAYGAYTFDELVKMIAAVLLGKASGLLTGPAVYRNLADSGDVISATGDTDGNRTAVTRTP